MITLPIIEKICSHIQIPAVGIAPWPLPEESRQILTDPEPCPFTESNIELRLQGTPPFTPKSAIVLLFPYYVDYDGPTNLSRYTWGPDYHLVVRHYLEYLGAELKNLAPTMDYEIHCDTSPLADRYLAYLAGLGFYGKNHCFINPTFGSYVLIGTLLTNLDLPPATPMNQSCMGCNTCITACPGQSLGHTYFKYTACKKKKKKKKGNLPLPEQNIIKKTPLLFGCDICQTVCPHNDGIPETPIPEFKEIKPILPVNTIWSITNKEFKSTYGHRAFSWRGKQILLRNDEYINEKKDR